MRLHIVNPNTTASMTERVRVAAERVARPDTTVDAVTASDGPASIEGWYDETFAAVSVLDAIRVAEQADAHVIACFDDTGLDAARCATDRPVLGIGEAAYHAASFLAVRFSVITTLARSIPALEHNLARYGLAARCARVRACEVPVLALETPGGDARVRLEAEIETALAEDGCDAIVLGCAGMADLADSLSARFRVPVVDGVAAAVGFAEALHRLGARTSSAGAYAPPRAKRYAGAFAGFAPVDHRS